MKEIDNYMTPAEAAFKWGIPQETLKNKLKPSLAGQDHIDNLIDGGLIKCFIKPDGKRKEWVVSTQAMELWFGKNK